MFVLRSIQSKHRSCGGEHRGAVAFVFYYDKVVLSPGPRPEACQTCVSIGTESAGSCCANFCFCSRRVATQLRWQAIACTSLGAVCARVSLWSCVLPLSSLWGCLSWCVARSTKKRENKTQTCRKDVTSKMKRRGVKNGSQNWSQNGSKMAPKWLALLGAL